MRLRHLRHSLMLAAPPLVACLLILPDPASAQILQYADRAPDSVQHVAGPGLLILFDTGEEARWLNAIEMYGSYHGDEAGPDADFQLYVIDLEGRLLRRVSLPYSLWPTGRDDWCGLPIPPMKVPREFGIGLTFGAGGTPSLETEIMLGGRLLLEGQLLRGYRLQGRAQGNVRVGLYNVDESHSYTWRPGSPGDGLWDKDWMVRAYVSDTPDGDPEGTDLILPSAGGAFFDRVLSAEGNPLSVRTASHGALPREEIAAIRMNAVAVPMLSTAVVTLLNGRTVEGALIALDADAIRIRTSPETETSIARADVARIDFRTIEPVPIAPQVEPPVHETRRAWGPEQATGPPDTDHAGDIRTAWATKRPDGGLEWLLLTYEAPVDIAQVRIRETFNPGAVSKVTAVPEGDTEVLLWEGVDPTTEAPADFVVEVAEEVRANQVKVYLETARKHGWNEIDAVELVGKDGARQWAFHASASSSYAD